MMAPTIDGRSQTIVAIARNVTAAFMHTPLIYFIIHYVLRGLKSFQKNGTYGGMAKSSYRASELIVPSSNTATMESEVLEFSTSRNIHVHYPYATRKSASSS